MKKKLEDMNNLEELKDLYEHELKCLDEIDAVLEENVDSNSTSREEIINLIESLKGYYEEQLYEIKTLSI